MSGPLAGRSILLPRSPERGAGLAALLREAGADVIVAPVIERAPALDQVALADAVSDVVAGRYAWTVITSVNAVDALAGALPDDAMNGALASAPTAWAAVGPATVRALRTLGVAPILVPATATAAGLVEAFPSSDEEPAQVGVEMPRASSSNRKWRSRSERERDGARGISTPTGPEVLLPLGDLAKPTLERGLTTKGWHPHVVTAYRTVRSDLPPDVVAQRYDAVVVTSGSVAREVAAQVGTRAPVVTIGTPSADVAREVGLTVAAIASTPTDDALAAAVITALEENP